MFFFNSACASAASSVSVRNILNAVAAAATTDRTNPSGLALTAILKSNMASFAPLTLFVRDKNADTLPHIAEILCAAATAKTAALYVPYVAMTVRRIFPTVSQFSTREETMSREVSIIPSVDSPILSNICSILSFMLEMRPAIPALCSFIRPPNLLPSFVRLIIACSTSGNPTLPSVTRSRTLLSVTPNMSASSSAIGIPRPRN